MKPGDVVWLHYCGGSSKVQLIRKLAAGRWRIKHVESGHVCYAKEKYMEPIKAAPEQVAHRGNPLPDAARGMRHTGYRVGPDVRGSFHLND